MKFFAVRFVLVVGAAFALLAAPASAMAEDGCAARIIKARAAEIPGMKIDRVDPVETGIVVSVVKPAKKGVVVVGMTVSGLDLVTFQSVLGRDGASDVTAEESAWLKQLFDRLFPDADFRACPELVRPEKPTAEAVFAVTQAWWKEQTQVDDELSGRTRLPVILVAVTAAVLVIGLAVIIVARRRRKDGEVEAKDPGTAPVDPEVAGTEVDGDADVAEDVPVDEGGATAPEDPEEVL